MHATAFVVQILEHTQPQPVADVARAAQVAHQAALCTILARELAVIMADEMPEMMSAHGDADHHGEDGEHLLRVRRGVDLAIPNRAKRHEGPIDRRHPEHAPAGRVLARRGVAEHVHPAAAAVVAHAAGAAAAIGRGRVARIVACR